MAWQLISPEMAVKSARQLMGLMMKCYGKAVKNVGILGVNVREMKVLTVKMETVTLSGKGR
jgi:hypothetical protein